MEGTEDLNELFRAHFQGHEMPVDPGVWQGIAGKLQLASPGGDGVGELFRERFAEHAMEVDPSVWQGISAQLGHGVAATGAAAGTQGALWGSGIAAALVITGLAYWYTGEAPATQEQGTLVERTQETPDKGPNEPRNAALPLVVDAAPTDATPNAVQEEPLATRPQNSRTDVMSGPVDAPSREAEVPERGTEVPEVIEPKGIATGPHYDDVERILQQAVVETVVHPTPKDPERIPQAGEGVQEAAMEQPSAGAGYTLFIPNVFSPNSDNLNDELRPEGEGLDQFQRVIVRIYSASTDQLVFSANSLESWDGRDPSGQLCPDGYYFYALEAIGPDGRTITKGQTVRLFR